MPFFSGLMSHPASGRWRPALPVWLLAGLLLAGCGETTSAPAAATTAPATTVPAATSAAATVPTSFAAITLAATTLAATTLGATSAATTTAASTTPAQNLPILFVHGNGDSSSLWITTVWRFESAGWPRDRLFALDFPYPNARDDDSAPQPSRSGSEEQRLQLAARVDEILAATGADRLALVGSSRGGNSIRNFIKHGGAAKVSHAILCGTPNHGVYSAPGNNSEFNGAGRLLQSLNAGSEITPGVAFMTIRSDRFDKFAQPELSSGRPSGIAYDSPELKGATNVVLPNLDHREVAFSAPAFAEMYKFLTGRPPASTAIRPEDRPALSGKIAGYENRVPTNQGVAGVNLAIYEVDPRTGARSGPAVYQTTTGPDGRWGVFQASPAAYYEFEVRAPDGPVRHFFRSPFPRSSPYVGLRLFPDEPAPGKATVYFTRPRGYVAAGRDTFLLDGRPVPGVKPGVPTDASFRVELDGPQRPVPVELNGETLTVRAIVGAVVYAEFHY